MKILILALGFLTFSTANAQFAPSFDRTLLMTVSTVHSCGYYYEDLKPALTKEYLGVIARTGIDWPKDIWSPRMFSEKQVKKDFVSAPSKLDCESYIELIAAGQLDKPALEAYRIRAKKAFP